MTDDREREIRAVLDLSPTRLVEHWDNYAELYEWADNERSRRIRAILDSAPPAPQSIVGGEPLEPLVSTATTARRRDVHIAQTPDPRVFFPGDTVPSGTPLMLDDGSLLECDTVDEIQSESDGVAIELLGIPTREEWQTTVDRAHQVRLAEATAQALLSDPGTGEA